MMEVEWQHGSSTLSEYDEDNFLGIQVDVFGELNSGMPAFEAIHPQGIMGRPRDPDERGTASNLYFYQGSQAFVMSTGDPRAVTGGYLPQIAKGSSIQYADRGLDENGEGKGASFYLIDGDDGTHTAYYQYEDGSTSHVFSFGLDGSGEPYVGLAHGDGMGLSFYKKKSILKNADGSVYLQLDDDGLVVNGNIRGTGTFNINGARIDTLGDLITKTGVSLMTHIHPTAVGPTSVPTPTSLPAL